jgi:hypothetical protein
VVVLVALPLALVALQGVVMVEVLLARLQPRVPPIQVQVAVVAWELVAVMQPLVLQVVQALSLFDI